MQGMSRQKLSLSMGGQYRGVSASAIMEDPDAGIVPVVVPRRRPDFDIGLVAVVFRVGSDRVRQIRHRRRSDATDHDLPLNFHPGTTGARFLFTPNGAG